LSQLGEEFRKRGDFVRCGDPVKPRRMGQDRARPVAGIFAWVLRFRETGHKGRFPLFVVTETRDHVVQFFKRDEAAAMAKLVLIDGDRQLVHFFT
jgi:hypothetical protein